MRRSVAVVLALLALALLPLTGCGGRQPPSPRIERWKAGRVQPGSLLVMRASESSGGVDVLRLVDPASGGESALWSAPAGFDARLLCADGSRIAVALSKRGFTDVTSKPETSGAGIVVSGLPTEQYVVVLQRDGTVDRARVPESTTTVISSGAFLGGDLVLAMTLPDLRRPGAGPLLVMDQRGRFAVPALPPLTRVQQVVPFTSEATRVAAVLGGPPGTQSSFGTLSLTSEASITLDTYSISTTRGAEFLPGGRGLPGGEVTVVGPPAPAVGPATLLSPRLVSRLGGGFDLEVAVARFETDRHVTARPLGKPAEWPSGRLPRAVLPIAPTVFGGYLVAVEAPPGSQASTRSVAVRQLYRLPPSGRTLTPTPVILHEWPSLAPQGVALSVPFPVTVRLDTWLVVQPWER